MKLKCTGSISSSDKKIMTPFSKGKVYEASKMKQGDKAVPNELEVVGDRTKRNGENWQAVTAHPKGWVILGVATFEEVAE